MIHIKTQLNITNHALGTNKEDKDYYSKFQKLGRERGLPESPAEYVFLKHIKIPVEKGTKIDNITSDFQVINKNIAIEIDGAEFHNDEDDKKRDDIYFKNKYFIIRVTAKVLKINPDEACDYIRRLVENDLLIPYQVEYVNNKNVSFPKSLIDREIIRLKEL